MSAQTERRLHPRQILTEPDLVIIYPHSFGREQNHLPVNGKDSVLAYLHNMSKAGFLLESHQSLPVDTHIDLWARVPSGQDWQAFGGRVVWTKQSPSKSSSFLLGIELRGPDRIAERPASKMKEPKGKMCPGDLEFLVNTSPLHLIPLRAKCPLLDRMTPIQVKPGERFISQGDEGHAFYIIQEGACVVSVEKKGTRHAISRLYRGDIVGEIALLTGEPRTANVDAETDMVLWSLTKEQFASLCTEYPDVLDFLTELVTYRFSTEKVAANRTIGKYLIHEIIGRGGWSIVYRGTHTSLNMPVAIKMLKHDMAMNAEFAERFHKEAKIVAQLNHRNIVRVFDIEELFRTIFIIMEYLEGVPLDYILSSTPRLSIPEVLDILLQVCNGLDYAHKQGIIHQDIKPANVFVQSDGQAKIVDFGLSCTPGTVDFCFPGTIHYMSPEQIEGESVDERTDIYSFGIMAYEMITGQRPYLDDDPGKLMEAHLREAFPDPRTLVPDLPTELHYLLKRATQKDPSSRFHSFWEIIRDLQPFADKIGVETQTQRGRQRKLKSLLVFYQEGQQRSLNRLVEEFNREVKNIGAELKVTDEDEVR
jgi:CRP-like cAMP-binding protein